MFSFPNLEPVCRSMSGSNCCLLTCIQVSQEAGKVFWYSHLLKNFSQFIVIHTVKGFGVVNKAEVYVFLELSCFFQDPVDVGNLISGSSAFSKTSLNIWKFTVHILLKPGLENFEHYFTSVAFFIVQLLHPYMTTGKTIALTKWAFVSKVMSLLFNMLSRLVITFPPRSKRRKS